MTPEFERIEALFGAASEIESPAEREAFLARECAGDDPLRRRVEAMLQAEAEAAEYFKGPALGPTEPAASGASVVVGDAPGTEAIGRYRLIEKLGEGGFGVVYVAEQTEPVQRQVALKIVKAGMDSREVVSRFAQERQALALMDHPSIAKVLDAGTTNAGRPYFAMELVRGVRITDFCEERKLGIRDRIELFIQVCRAVQHAHQKGVIHRDLKPSNILVEVHDGRPVPKIIDFGIAKAIAGRLSEATVFTQTHQLIGTPAYMSPEQAELSGRDIDTRSDIYSLGVLLYELLTGRTPFDARELAAQGLDGMRRIILEQEPVRPSTRLRQSNRSGAPAEDSRVTRYGSLPSDLDWIVMKCLEKDRARRYETAHDLTADLVRHLRHEPVTARPPTATYRFRKAWRRNRLAFAAAAVVTLLLVLGGGTSTWLMFQARQAQRGEERQRRAAEEALRVADAQAQRATLSEKHVRRLLYASDLSLAQQALKLGNLGKARLLLDRHRPKPGEEDLRGWEWRYLWQKLRGDASLKLCQHSNDIRGLTISGDGQWLAVLAGERDLTLWDLRAHRLFERLPGPDQAPASQVSAVAFSPQRAVLAYGFRPDRFDESSETVVLWDVLGRQVLAELPIGRPCKHLAFSEDGGRLLCFSVSFVPSAAPPEGTGQVTLWDVAARACLESFTVPDLTRTLVTSLSASRDLRTVAYCGTLADGRDLRRVHLRDMETGEERLSEGHGNRIQLPVLSPDGGLLAVALGDPGTNIRLWDVGTLRELGNLDGHRMWVNALVFWPDGKTLASASADSTVRLWDIAQQQTLGEPLRGHERPIRCLALSPDQHTLVSGDSGGAVLVWDVPRALGQPTATVTSEGLGWSGIRPDDLALGSDPSSYGRAERWCFGPDGQTMWTGDRDARIRRWSGEDFATPTLWIELGSSAYPVEFSADGRWLATSSVKGEVEVWDLPNREQRRVLAGGRGRASPASFLNGGKRLAVGYGGARTVLEFDLETGRERQTYTWKKAVALRRGRRSAFSPDDRWYLLLEEGGPARLIERSTGEEKILPLDVPNPVDVAFSPDSRFLAAANDSNFVRLWRTAPWRETVMLRGLTLGVNAVAFSPDSQRLVVTSRLTDAVKVYDVGTGQELLTIEEPTAIFGPVGFSPDGNLLVGLNDKLARVLWRAPSWEEIETAERAVP